MADISPRLAKNEVQIIQPYRPAADCGEIGIAQHVHDVLDGNVAMLVKVRD
jgi:hypothetical protein